MKIIICTLLLILVLQHTSYSQLQNFSFEEIDSLRQKKSKLIAIFLYTDWCKYCAQMKAQTFKDESIIRILNDKYYFTQFNAEATVDISFNNTTFSFEPNGPNTGTHSLAKALGTINDQLSYPTFVVLNTSMEIILQYDGFLDHRTIYAVLKKLAYPPKN